MKKNLSAEHARRKKSTNDAMWLLFILITLFTVIIARFALRSGVGNGFFNEMPSGSDAYEIARDYIRPTLRMPDTKFAEDGYQYAKTRDSVYVVKSYFITSFPINGKVKTNFTIRLKYNGGTSLNDNNWTLVNLQEY
jgi:hypothetical protein